MKREDMIREGFADGEVWDMIIIGGGATGVGVAVDAASRGYKVLLVEQSDFGKGTSSRSTKLVHGGVRYLEQGNISLVMEALRERGLLQQNAPHLVHDLAFVVPSYSWWESPFYGVGLKIYSLFSGKYKFGPTQLLSKEETLERLPTIKTDGLRGGVVYYDGQFDDTRLLINLAATAATLGATMLNYVRVTGLTRNADGFVSGVKIRDEESGRERAVEGRVVVNATGAFCDAVRRMADPEAAALIAPSQGIHLVFDRSFLGTGGGGDCAIMVPHTPDGRVMFAIPWHGHTLVGTTDVPVNDTPLEPTPTEGEIEMILETAGAYLRRPPTRADILSMFAGIRPLARAGNSKNTAAISREHTIEIDNAGLLTIAGGKWTTYRAMAEDCVNQAATLADLEERPCVTRTLRVHGHHASADEFGSLGVYGSDAPAITELTRSDPALAGQLHPDLPYTAGEIVWAAREEMSRTVEDALARRTRALFLNARAAVAMAPAVAALMARELGRDEAWEHAQVDSFVSLARTYVVR
jgi:glycerol-3-phosphate dehydrogenase